MTKRVFGQIVSPCEVSFESLEGEGAKRYCGRCNLNVYNFSEMTSDEIFEVSKNRKSRLCASIKTRPDGTIVTDNCPYKLRKLRTILGRYAPLVLTICVAVFHQTAADAQGLVGAPTHPRFGQSGEVGQLGEYGYDTAHDVSRVFMAVAVPLCFIGLLIQQIRDARTIALLRNQLGVCKRNTKHLVRNRSLLAALILTAPFVIHLISTFAINNFGGLASEF